MHATYQTFEYSITHSLYRYRYVYLHTYITLGKPENPSNPHPHPNFEKFSKFVPPLIHALVLPVFCFLCKKFSELLKFTLQNPLF